MTDRPISKREAAAHSEMTLAETPPARTWRDWILPAVFVLLAALVIGGMLAGCAPTGFLLECARRGAGCS